ncbi:MAG TPA: UDP-N-acetylglucosamine 1-carboxyvinyltransferase [Clostridiales bacterium]|nr:UDP-N-acetylglucosamine 1-carboxyvinyltransferase [Clostridiales bacterium]
MPSIQVIGGEKLQGQLKIQGSKNGSLPILAATILNKGTTILRNCPKIIDVYNMIFILKELGCKATWEDEVLIIDAKDVNSTNVSQEFVKKMRSSVLFLGALLGRFKEVSISYPGGCSIGSRPIDLHLESFEQMNVQEIVENDMNTIKCKTDEIIGNSINLRFPSVGATQNIILAAVLATGTTNIINAAREPEIDELCHFLNLAGANIKGIGRSRIIIKGVEKLHDIDYTITADRIVAGTYMAAIAITLGDAVLLSAPTKHLKSTIKVFKKLGCKIDIDNECLRIRSNNKPKAINEIITKPYPGFPTDMQSQLMSLLCISDGKSIINEQIFESRFQNVYELNKMGAKLTIKDFNKVEINGVKRLKAANLEAHDLRGGAALVIAALSAEGESNIENISLIERGYVDIVSDLQTLGANIKYY